MYFILDAAVYIVMQCLKEPTKSDNAKTSCVGVSKMQRKTLIFKLNYMDIIYFFIYYLIYKLLNEPNQFDFLLYVLYFIDAQKIKSPYTLTFNNMNSKIQFLPSQKEMKKSLDPKYLTRTYKETSHTT